MVCFRADATIPVIARKIHVATSSSINEKPDSEEDSLDMLEARRFHRGDCRFRERCPTERPLGRDSHGNELDRGRELRDLPDALVKRVVWWGYAAAEQRSISGEPVDVSDDWCGRIRTAADGEASTTRVRGREYCCVGGRVAVFQRQQLLHLVLGVFRGARSQVAIVLRRV